MDLEILKTMEDENKVEEGWAVYKDSEFFL
jgi:hypothetical protein